MKEKRINHRTMTMTTIGILLLVLVLFTLLTVFAAEGKKAEYNTWKKRTSYETTATELLEISGNLTDYARLFAVTGNKKVLFSYFHALHDIASDRHILDSLEEMAPDETAIASLYRALRKSQPLLDAEMRAMKLKILSMGITETSNALQDETASYMNTVLAYSLSPEEMALSAAQMEEGALTLVFGTRYTQTEQSMYKTINSFFSTVSERLSREVDAHRMRQYYIKMAQHICMGVFVFLLMGMMFLYRKYYIIPIKRYSRSIMQEIPSQTPLFPSGAKELILLGQQFNRMTEKIKLYAWEAGQKSEQRGQMITALTTLYTYSMYINLTKDRYTVLTGDMHSLLPALPMTGKYSDFMHEYKSTILSEDRDYYALLNRDNLLDAFSQGEQVLRYEFRQKQENETYRWYETLLVRVALEADEDIWIICVQKDMEEQKKLEEMLEKNREIIRTITSEHFIIFLADLEHDTYEIIRDGGGYVKSADKERYSDIMQRIFKKYALPEDLPHLTPTWDIKTIRSRMDRGKDHMLFPFRNINGQWYAFEYRKSVPYSKDKPHVIASIRQYENEMKQLEDERALQLKADIAAQNETIARRSNELKSMFLANMSHEIRTPMNAIVCMTEIALRDHPGDTMRSHLQQIKASSQTLLELINDILDLSKIEAGKMELMPHGYKVATLVNASTSLLEHRVGSKEIDFSVDVDENVPSELYGDDLRITEIMLNLGTNAIKFTHSGFVTIHIKTDKTDQEDTVLFTICVRDTGIGIHKEDLDTIFDTFQRSHLYPNKTVEGTGLGLSISKKLSRLMGGNLTVTSEPGRGSEFVCVIPQKIVNFTPIGNHWRQESVEENITALFDFIAPEANVLIVDDNAVNLSVCEQLLKPYQVKITTARSGFGALDAVKQKSFDLIFMDHYMPRMDGVKTTRQIRKMEGMSLGELPIIALTANAMKGADVFFSQNGMNDYVSKPIDIKLLEQALHKWLPAEKIQTMVNKEQGRDKSFGQIEGLDIKEAMQYFANWKSYLDNLSTFHRLLPSKIEKIRSALDKNDMDTFIIEVHSTKSDLQLIGATEEALLAELVEKNARILQKEKLWQYTKSFLSAIQRHYELLKPYFSKDAVDATHWLCVEEFDKKLSNLKRFVEDFDSTGADNWLENMKTYIIPPVRKALFEQLSKAIVSIDYAVLTNQLKDIPSSSDP
jgi:signal transduction histidine kinase/DNA-binding response OmpR family regulator